jgi:hypothetical protein
MRSLLSVATFAIGALCLVAFVTKVRPVFLTATAPSEQVERSGKLVAPRSVQLAR